MKFKNKKPNDEDFFSGMILIFMIAALLFFVMYPLFGPKVANFSTSDNNKEWEDLISSNKGRLIDGDYVIVGEDKIEIENVSKTNDKYVIWYKNDENRLIELNLSKSTVYIYNDAETKSYIVKGDAYKNRDVGVTTNNITELHLTNEDSEQIITFQKEEESQSNESTVLVGLKPKMRK